MKDLYNRTLEINQSFRNESEGRHHKPHSINFEAYAAEGNRFINDVADMLDTDRNTAARKCRAVLHALRDRLPPIDAVQFGQGLPMAMKAVYFDRYDIAKTPLRIRSGRKFLDLIYEKDGRSAPLDFPDNYSLVEALRGVYSVLETHMDEEQTGHIKHMLHYEIVRLIEGRPLRRVRMPEYA
jgi:uncharacterized protein (DUF2267 family)